MYYYDSYLDCAASVPTTLAYESHVPSKPVKPALRHSRLGLTHRLALQVTVIVDAHVYTVVPVFLLYDPTVESLHS